MAESNKKTMIWKKHELDENIGYDQFKSNQSWTGNFSFVIGADSQLGYIWPFKERNEKDWKIEMEKSILAVDKINKMFPRPQFLVICGDLVNEMPNQNTEINKQIYSKLHPSISLICVCGNHDVGNIPNEEIINRYRDNFGQDYFSFWCGGVLFLVINSQYYKNWSEVEKLSKEQDQWLTEKLNQHKGQRIIVFQHIQWFLDDIDEDNGYFNLDKTIRRQMLEKQNTAGVSHIFTGHYHRNYTRFYKNLELVTTNAIGAPMGEDPSGLRIVNVYENSITHTYYSLEQMPIELKCMD